MSTIMISYGTHVFTKFKGYYGRKEECPYCQRKYQQAYVKFSKWFHLIGIPLFPVKRTYYKMCPICAYPVELTVREAKDQMERAYDNIPEQKIELYGKHVSVRKPKNIFAHDFSYDFCVKDLISGEEFCIAANLSKDRVKQIAKERGLKKIPFVEA